MNMTDFRDSEKFLLSLNVGEGYNDIVVTKKTKKRIYLSNGKIVTIKKNGGGFLYLDSAKNGINQILRDIEGFLIYKIYC
jgi:hypothetical protein